MKLKKLMRKECIDFPDGAKYATQDKDETISFWAVVPYLLGDSWFARERVGYTRTTRLASNWRTKIVTREELED